MRLTISIPSELKKKLAEAAKSDRRSISNYTARIIEEFVGFKKQPPQKKAA